MIARELQTCTFEGSGASNTTKIPREDTQRETQRAKIGAGEGKKKKARNFGPPPFGALRRPHPSTPPPFGAPPFGAPPFGPNFHGFGPHPLGPHHDTPDPKMDWPKLDWPKLVKSGWPKRDWPKSAPSSWQHQASGGDGTRSTPKVTHLARETLEQDQKTPTCHRILPFKMWSQGATQSVC